MRDKQHHDNTASVIHHHRTRLILPGPWCHLISAFYQGMYQAKLHIVLVHLQASLQLVHSSILHLHWRNGERCGWGKDTQTKMLHLLWQSSPQKPNALVGLSFTKSSDRASLWTTQMNFAPHGATLPPLLTANQYYQSTEHMLIKLIPIIPNL